MLIVIFILSIIKVPETEAPEYTDKIVHIIMYIFCAGAFYFIGIKRFVLSAISYGILLEIIQYFLPWRSFSIADIIANTIGAMLFLLFFSKLIKSSH